MMEVLDHIPVAYFISFCDSFECLCRVEQVFV